MHINGYSEWLKNRHPLNILKELRHIDYIPNEVYMITVLHFIILFVNILDLGQFFKLTNGVNALFDAGFSSVIGFWYPSLSNHTIKKIRIVFFFFLKNNAKLFKLIKHRYYVRHLQIFMQLINFQIFKFK